MCSSYGNEMTQAVGWTMSSNYSFASSQSGWSLPLDCNDIIVCRISWAIILYNIADRETWRTGLSRPCRAEGTMGACLAK